MCLGHSTIVFFLAVAIIFAATSVKHHLPALQNLGGIIGATFSGTFLWLIRILNLLTECGRVIFGSPAVARFARGLPTRRTWLAVPHYDLPVLSYPIPAVAATELARLVFGMSQI